MIRELIPAVGAEVSIVYLIGSRVHVNWLIQFPIISPNDVINWIYTDAFTESFFFHPFPPFLKLIAHAIRQKAIDVISVASKAVLMVSGDIGPHPSQEII